MRVEHWGYRLSHWLRSVLRRRAMERELDDELRDHIEHQTAANLAAGMPPDAAYRAALVAFGGVERIKDESRDVRGLSLIDAIGQARYTLRGLVRARTFTIACLTTIALAVAAGSGMWTLVDTVLLEPLPYPDSNRLVGLWHAAPGLDVPLLPQTAGTYTLYRTSARSLASIGAYIHGTSPVSCGDATALSERVPVAGLTASIFPTLGAHALIGRVFTDTDELPNTRKVVIVSEAFWRSELDASPQVLGQHIRLDGIDREIVGVMPASFRFPGSDIRVWAPIIVDPQGYLGLFGIQAVARLRPGVSVAAAQQELQQILMRAPETYPEQRPGLSTAAILERSRTTVVIHTLREDAIGGFAPILWLVAAVAGVLVLVALSNISSLVLARADARRREFAVRSVLGASWPRVACGAIAEVVLVTLSAGAVGCTLAAGLLALLPHTGATRLVDPRVTDASRIVLPRVDEIHPDLMLVLSAVALTAVFSLVGSIVALSRVTIDDPARVLREAGRTGSAGRASHRLRAAFVGVEIALSLMLLSGSAMLDHSLLRLLRVDPGFDSTNRIIFWTALRGTTYFEPPVVAQFYRQAVERIERVPGVVAVGIVSKPPLQNGPLLEFVTPEDVSSGGSLGSALAVAEASDGYFDAMGIPILSGRTFDESNVRRGAEEAVVSRAFAVRYWHDSTGERALGRRLRTSLSAAWYTIVGVVGDVRDTALTAPASEVVYLPQDIGPKTDDIGRARHDMMFVVHTRGAGAQLTRSLEHEIHALDPSVPLTDLQPASALVTRAGRRLRFVMLLLAIGAMATLALGIVGIYGVVAFVVGMRSREIAIRIALGLTPWGATRDVLFHGMSIAAAGAVAGLGLFLFFARLLRSVAFQTGTVDALSLVCTTGLTLVIATVATWMPARRAAAIDPAEALRGE